MPTARTLYDLQKIDLETDAIEESLKKFDFELNDRSAILSAKQLLVHLSDSIKEATSTQKRTEHKITALHERLKKIDDNLYGGSLKTQREMSAAEEEREFTANQIRDDENIVLEVMVKIENLHPKKKQAQDSLDKLQADRPHIEAKILTRKKQITKELEALSHNRMEMALVIQPHMLSLYESLRKTTNGQAVSMVERGTCQSCRLALPTMEIHRARKSQTIVQCNSCRRILYVP